MCGIRAEIRFDGSGPSGVALSRGLDFIVSAVDGEDYGVIEANERSGLTIHGSQPTAERVIDPLFTQTMIPASQAGPEAGSK